MNVNDLRGTEFVIIIFLEQGIHRKTAVPVAAADMQCARYDLWIHMVWPSNFRHGEPGPVLAGHLRARQSDGQLVLQHCDLAAALST